MARPIGVGIIGMGFIGRTHAKAFADAATDECACELRAVCDPNEERRAGRGDASGNLGGSDVEWAFDPLRVRSYERAADLLADDGVDLVCVCTPTDTHVDLAIRALEAGKHALVEKPVAIRSAEVERLMHAAAGSDRVVIPAMCVRWWPGWSDLKRMVDDGRYGRVLHARFERLGAAPGWSSDFYGDESRSGGAVFDLHVHDADFARYLLGMPHAVFSSGGRSHIHTLAVYSDGVSVSVEGGWVNDPSFEFRMAYRVEFERAAVTFDSRRSPAMRIHRGGTIDEPDIGTRSGFDEQARAVCSSLHGNSEHGFPTLADALAVTRLIEAELESAASGRVVALG